MIVKYAITSSLVLQHHHHHSWVVNRRLAPPTTRGVVIPTIQASSTPTPTSTTALPSTLFWDGDGIHGAATSLGNSIQSSISTLLSAIGAFVSQTQENVNAAVQQLLPPSMSSSMSPIIQQQPPLVLPSPPENILQVQQFGEKVFAATFLVAFVQVRL